MSNKYLTWAFSLTDMLPSEKLVMIKLADQCNDDGLCWPSQKTIAAHCCLTRESVNRVIKRLAERGLLKIVPRTVEGVRLPNYYQLPALETDHKISSSPWGGSDPGSPDVVIQDHTHSDPGSHKPLLNPHIEPIDASPSANPKSSAKQKTEKSSLPENFPGDDDRAKAKAYWRNNNRSDIPVEREAEKFRAHCEKNGSRFVSWPAAWRTWYVNAVEFARRGNGPPADAAPSGVMKWV